MTVWLLHKAASLTEDILQIGEVLKTSYVPVRKVYKPGQLVNYPKDQILPVLTCDKI